MKDTFKKYNLDINKNFIEMPYCTCGCNHKCIVQLENSEDVIGFSYNILMNNPSYNAAVFANGMKSNYIIIKHIGKHYPSHRPITEEEFYNFDPTYDYDDIFEDEDGKYGITIDAIECSANNHKIFKKYVDEFKFDSYGVIAEYSTGKWKAIEK